MEVTLASEPVRTAALPTGTVQLKALPSVTVGAQRGDVIPWDVSLLRTTSSNQTQSSLTMIPPLVAATPPVLAGAAVAAAVANTPTPVTVEAAVAPAEGAAVTTTSATVEAAAALAAVANTSLATEDEGMSGPSMKKAEFGLKKAEYERKMTEVSLAAERKESQSAAQHESLREKPMTAEVATAETAAAVTNTPMTGQDDVRSNAVNPHKDVRTPQKVDDDGSEHQNRAEIKIGTLSHSHSPSLFHSHPPSLSLCPDAHSAAEVGAAASSATQQGDAMLAKADNAPVTGNMSPELWAQCGHPNGEEEEEESESDDAVAVAAAGAQPPPSGAAAGPATVLTAAEIVGVQAYANCSTRRAQGIWSVTAIAAWYQTWKMVGLDMQKIADAIWAIEPDGHTSSSGRLYSRKTAQQIVSFWINWNYRFPAMEVYFSEATRQAKSWTELSRFKPLGRSTTSLPGDNPTVRLTKVQYELLSDKINVLPGWNYLELVRYAGVVLTHGYDYDMIAAELSTLESTKTLKDLENLKVRWENEVKQSLAEYLGDEANVRKKGRRMAVCTAIVDCRFPKSEKASRFADGRVKKGNLNAVHDAEAVSTILASDIHTTGQAHIRGTNNLAEASTALETLPQAAAHAAHAALSAARHGTTGRTTCVDKKKRVGSTTPVARARLVKDKNRPKRATSAYVYFATSIRDELLAENPDVRKSSLGALAKLTGARWATLTGEEKRPFQDQFEDDKVRYYKEMETYVPPKPVQLHRANHAQLVGAPGEIHQQHQQWRSPSPWSPSDVARAAQSGTNEQPDADADTDFGTDMPVKAGADESPNSTKLTEPTELTAQSAYLGPLSQLSSAVTQLGVLGEGRKERKRIRLQQSAEIYGPATLAPERETPTDEGTPSAEYMAIDWDSAAFNRLPRTRQVPNRFDPAVKASSWTSQSSGRDDGAASDDTTQPELALSSPMESTPLQLHAVDGARTRNACHQEAQHDELTDELTDEQSSPASEHQDNVQRSYSSIIGAIRDRFPLLFGQSQSGYKGVMWWKTGYCARYRVAAASYKFLILPFNDVKLAALAYAIAVAVPACRTPAAMMAVLEATSLPSVLNSVPFPADPVPAMPTTVAAASIHPSRTTTATSPAAREAFDRLGTTDCTPQMTPHSNAPDAISGRYVESKRQNTCSIKYSSVSKAVRNRFPLIPSPMEKSASGYKGVDNKTNALGSRFIVRYPTNNKWRYLGTFIDGQTAALAFAMTQDLAIGEQFRSLDAMITFFDANTGTDADIVFAAASSAAPMASPTAFTKAAAGDKPAASWKRRQSMSPPPAMASPQHHPESAHAVAAPETPGQLVAVLQHELAAEVQKRRRIEDEPDEAVAAVAELEGKLASLQSELQVRRAAVVAERERRAKRLAEQDDAVAGIRSRIEQARDQVRAQAEAGSNYLADTVQPPNWCLCPISRDVMVDPVLAGDGFTYERAEIVKWFRQSNNSPMTNEILRTSLVTNRTMKAAIEDWRQHHA